MPLHRICLLAALLFLSTAPGCNDKTSDGPTDGDGSSFGDGKSAADDTGPAAELPAPAEEAGATDLRAADATVTTTYDGQPGEFALSASGRAYRMLVPAGYSPTAAIPLVVGFHGAGDTGSNFYAICKAAGWAQAAAPANFIMLIPDTKSPYLDFAIWSGDPVNDVPQMKQEMAEIIAIINQVGTHYHVDPARIHAFGFSDGGLFVAVAGMDRSDLFGSLSIMGYGWGSGYPLITPQRKIPVQFIVGTGDQFYSSAQQSESYLQAQGHPTRLLSAAGVGHTFLGLMQQHSPATIFAWMAQHPALP